MAFKTRIVQHHATDNGINGIAKDAVLNVTTKDLL